MCVRHPYHPLVTLSLYSYSLHHPLLRLLLHVRREVVVGIVGVHKGAIDNRHRLNDVLQTLAQIVAILERHVGIEHNVHLHNQLVAGMVRLQALDGFDRLGKAHCQVEYWNG